MESLRIFWTKATPTVVRNYKISVVNICYQSLVYLFYLLVYDPIYAQA